MKNPILRLLIAATIFALISGVVVSIIGIWLGWTTSTALTWTRPAYRIRHLYIAKNRAMHWRCVRETAVFMVYASFPMAANVMSGLITEASVGQGEFVPQGTLEVAGQPAQRVLLVCPTGEVTSIWYHQDEGMPSIARGNLEFGLIFSASSSHCETGYSLSGKVQHVGEMIISSLNVP